MELLLVRHGQAVEDAPGIGDAGRWLSQKGRKTTRRVARWLDENKKRRPATIWTSPLVRSVQTAEILAAETGYKGEIRAIAELSPGRDPGDLLRLLSEVAPPQPIALVGHEPSLSVLVTAMLGNAAIGSIRKSGIVALTWKKEGSELRFVLDPADMKKAKKFAARASRDTKPPPSAKP